jgi:hypothetical protein
MSSICRRVLQQTIQRLFQIANRLVGAALLHRVGDAVIDVMFQDELADLVERGAHGGYLRQHLVALPPFVPQSFQAGGVSCNPRQPLSNFLSCRLCSMGHPDLRRYIPYPPWGDNHSYYIASSPDVNPGMRGRTVMRFA